ncbi:MAG: hypothetical protein H6R12_1900, partial [Proteobacteria bacterium]|nr:hypothetical protein [Pseudomonadota bacterium]
MRKSAFVVSLLSFVGIAACTSAPAPA